MIKASLASVLIVGLCWSAHAASKGPAGDPDVARAQIRETSEAVLALFRERELFKAANTDRLLARLHTILDERFDWIGIAKWVLGRNRSRFDAAQTKEFADVFSRYVVLYYLTQVEQFILTDDPNAVDKIKVDYREGRKRRDGAVTLEVAFVTPKGTEVVTGYTLVHDRRTQAWKVRNFIVEGISLVRNWRSELASVRSREKIMTLLNEKVESLRRERLEKRKEDAE